MKRPLVAAIVLGYALGTLGAQAQGPDAPPAAASPPAPLEVTIIGSRDDTLQKLPGSGYFVGAKELRRAQPVTSEEILRRVPGVTVRSEDAFGLRLNIGMRGLDSTRSRRVLVLEDGVPIAINPYSEPDLYYSPPIERMRAIEVVKGSGSILFGPQTIGGVVNFITLPPPDREQIVLEAAQGHPGYTKLLGSYGSSVGDVRYVVQVLRKQGSGARDEELGLTDVFGKVVFPTSRRGELQIKLGAFDEDSRTTYLGMTRSMYEQDERRTTRSFAPYDRFRVRRYEATLTHDHRFSENTKLRTLVYAHTTSRAWRRQDFDRSAVSGVDYERITGDADVPNGALYLRNTNHVRDRHYEVAGVEPRLEHRLETGPVRHTLSVGARGLVETARRRLYRGEFPTSNAGVLENDESGRVVAFAGHVQDRIGFLDTLLITPGVRYEHVSVRRHVRRDLVGGTARDVFIRGESTVGAMIPGIGMVLGAKRLAAYGGVHTGFAPPRISSAITPGGKDTQLDEERSVNYELGLRGSPLRWLSFDATAFLIEFKNQIVPRTRSSGAATSELVNGGRTRHYGAEASSRLALGGPLALGFELDLAARYTFARAVFVGGPLDPGREDQSFFERFDGGKLLPYSPLHTAGATLDVELPSGPGGQIAYSYTGAQFTDDRNTVVPDATGLAGRIDPFHTLDFMARYRHKPTGLMAYLSVKNVPDQVYIASRLPAGIHTAGFRQAILGVRWEH